MSLYPRRLIRGMNPLRSCNPAPPTLQALMVSRWQIFEGAEITLERVLEKNPAYPFQVLYTDNDGGSLVYAHSKRLPYIYFGSLACVASIVFVLVLVLFNGNKEYTLFGVVIFLVGMWFCLEYYSIRSVILEPSIHQYSLYHGSHLVLIRHIHNIYIRLHQKKTGLTEYKFYLVINGWGFEAPITVSRLTINKTKLRSLGLRIAENLNLNYFDVQDVSKEHVIRHLPPQPTFNILYNEEEND